MKIEEFGGFKIHYKRFKIDPPMYPTHPQGDAPHPHPPPPPPPRGGLSEFSRKGARVSGGKEGEKVWGRERESRERVRGRESPWTSSPSTLLLLHPLAPRVCFMGFFLRGK